MSKKLLLTLLVLSSSLLAFSQGTWTPRDTLPDSAMVQGISGFTIGNYGYAGLGNYSNAIIVFDYFWQFDPSSNLWARKASFPGRARIEPATFVIGNKAYLVTGTERNCCTCVTDCWEYNATTNKWTQKTSFPGSARTYAVGFAINGTGYVGTGANIATDFRKDFYAYDTAGVGSWIRIADFPGIARVGSCGFTVNGKGYVCFGQDSNSITHNDMWEYDPGTNRWTQKTSNPDSMAGATGFAICDNIYVGSGDPVPGVTGYRKFWKYNTVSDTWTQEASVPAVKHFQGAAFSVGDTGYFGFGCDTDAIVHNLFYSFYANDSCIITGNNTYTEASEISLYPNPFKDECYIGLPIGINKTPVFSLFNMEGLKQEIDIKNHDSNYTLTGENLKEGVYILSIKYNDRIYYKKLVITY